MAAFQGDAYCTLLMSNDYLPGAAVLAQSLRDAGTKKQLAVLVTLDTLSADTLTELKALYDHVIPVDRIANPNPANLYLMGRGDLSFAFTKIALWRQQRFRKLVYLDSDTVVLRAPDELFDIDAPFAAAPDVGWPDAFNTGVMVIKPNMGDYWALQTMASTGDSFDGADQGLLNQYYQHRNWHRLSFSYNCTPNAQYQWEPAYRYYKSNISVVHFIGKKKPWREGRHASTGGPGTYNELLARWWAVYDRHYKAPAVQFTAREPTLPPKVVQQHVEGESTSTDFGYSALASYPTHTETREPEAPIVTTEQPFTDPGDPVENIAYGNDIPVPTVEQRRFSAPQAEWDATRMPPPVESKPEAAHLPVQAYEFNESKELFQPPQSYPEPPKDMWYEIPKQPPSPAAKPKAIFPWEERTENVKPTRVFSEDKIPEPEPSPPLPTNTQTEEPPQPAIPDVEESKEPARPVEEPFASFSSRNVNAWDNHPGIDSYTRAFENAIFRRSGARAAPQPADILTTVPADPSTTSDNNGSILSPSPSRNRRRESLILTDFPSAVERPSLPVTPMPIRRPSFWGEERRGGDSDNALPGAAGVPDQADWDPGQQLENLRRQSLVTAEEAAQRLAAAQDAGREIPLREMPGSSAALLGGAGGTAVKAVVVPPFSGGSSPHGLTATTAGPPFQLVDFGGGGRTGEEGVEPVAPEEKV
ncbi:MAG: glycogenin glucosyltransferase [Bathelium mastoideum]|nr:MAG: glycogenin glucosyltransferase [Bathelium mastoideum]